MTKNPFGPSGDFTTSPNISRLFSEMVAIWVVSFWHTLGCPKKFNLIELGAGNGEMMKVMIESFKRFPSFFKSCNFIIHEKSPRLIKKQKANIKFRNVKWVKNLIILNNLPNIFLANEFFDAIPIKQFFKKKNNWYEKYIQILPQKEYSFSRKQFNISKLNKKFNFEISKKQNFIEYSPLGLKYLKDILRIIQKNHGGLLIIDYGYFGKKMRNTLQAIHNKKHSKVLENIGKTDITHNINYYIFDKIVKSYENLSVNYTTQKKFLTKMGIHERAELISRNKTFKEKADIFYRLKRLTDDNEMGKLFKVMLIKNLEIKTQIGF
jgi:cyclopropane-fatty-acyl-phospholipid synthase